MSDRQARVVVILVMAAWAAGLAVGRLAWEGWLPLLGPILAAAPDCRRYEDARHVCAPTFAGCACASVSREATPTPYQK